MMAIYLAIFLSALTIVRPPPQPKGNRGGQARRLTVSKRPIGSGGQDVDTQRRCDI